MISQRREDRREGIGWTEHASAERGPFEAMMAPRICMHAQGRRADTGFFPIASCTRGPIQSGNTGALAAYSLFECPLSLQGEG